MGMGFSAHLILLLFSPGNVSKRPTGGRVPSGLFSSLRFTLGKIGWREGGVDGVGRLI